GARGRYARARLQRQDQALNRRSICSPYFSVTLRRLRLILGVSMSFSVVHSSSTRKNFLGFSYPLRPSPTRSISPLISSWTRSFLSRSPVTPLDSAHFLTE